MWVIILYCFLHLLISLLELRFENDPEIYAYINSSFTFLEYSLFSYFYLISIKNLTFKRALLIVSVIFLIFILFYFLNVKAQGLDSVPIGIETILILTFSFYFLYEQMKDTETLFVYNKPEFWVVLGIMIYLAGSFFFYMFANFSSDAVRYWFFTNVFSILKTISFIIAILIYTKGPTNNNPKSFTYHPYLN